MQVLPFGYPGITGPVHLPRAFSQLSTSFFGSRRLGILRVPFPSFSSLNLSFLQLLLFYLLFISHCPSFLGGDKRVRTADLCLARAALSQLSYIPIQILRLHSVHGGHDWTRTSDPCVISTVL